MTQCIICEYTYVSSTAREVTMFNVQKPQESRIVAYTSCVVVAAVAVCCSSCFCFCCSCSWLDATHKCTSPYKADHVWYWYDSCGINEIPNTLWAAKNRFSLATLEFSPRSSSSSSYNFAPRGRRRKKRRRTFVRFSVASWIKRAWWMEST